MSHGMSLTATLNSCAPCCGPDVTGAHLALAQIQGTQETQEEPEHTLECRNASHRLGQKKTVFCLNRAWFLLHSLSLSL